MNILILLVLLMVMVSLSVPIGISLGAATAITMAVTSTIPFEMISQNAFTGLDSFPLMAIPYFVLAGNLMALGGIAKRIVVLCDMLLGKVSGGIGMATIAASMFFAAISGSAPATVSAMGTMMIPEMEKRGYEKGFATGLTATAGTIGVIIPPSIPFVVYGVAASVSIGDLFIAGVLPGLMIGMALMLVCYVISRKRGYKGMGKSEKQVMSQTMEPSMEQTMEPAMEQTMEQAMDQTMGQVGNAQQGKSFLAVLFNSIPALLTPVIILGGIYGGIFTPTEAAAVAIVYSVVIGVFVYKELTWEIWINSLKNTADLNGLTALAMGFSMAFASYLAMEQIPVMIGTALTGAISSNFIIMLLMLLILLIFGLFIDNVSSCLILTPVFLPIAKMIGMDPVQFGVVMTTALAIGFVTPPYGANLFIASAISDLKIEQIAKPAVPFIAAMLCCLLLITFVPDISMGLVHMMQSR